MSEDLTVVSCDLLAEDAAQSASTMTKELKEIGGGSMREGLRRIYLQGARDMATYVRRMMDEGAYLKEIRLAKQEVRCQDAVVGAVAIALTAFVTYHITKCSMKRAMQNKGDCSDAVDDDSEVE